jgi:two-component system response regulator PilR (NtrC family)
MEVLQHSRRVSPDTMVIVITAVDDSDVPIEALNAGAFYYIRKGPKLLEDVLTAAALALDGSRLRQQNAALRRDAAQRNSLDNIIGESEPMRLLKQTIRTIATTTSTVIVSGESGTGKELVARAIHTCSPRSSEAFVSVNCGAFPETLLESELFGYVKGSFTGATSNKHGLFELSSGGTIFLDEISETTLPMQVKLLRVLQERCIRPVGGGQETPVDVRVIAATNKNLLQLVQDGQFREDLYYRLSVIPVQVPPLRDRGEDIVLLANHFLKKFAVQMGKNVVRLSPESLSTMKGYDWPGNVRVLENTIERAVAMSTEEELRIDLPNSGASSIPTAAANAGALGVVLPSDGIDLERYIADVEKSLLQSALRRSNGIQTRAAELLRLSYRSFRHMMKKYDLS